MRTRLMLALTAALAIVFGGAGAALATAPVTLDSARVLDQSGVLSQTQVASVDSELRSLSTTAGVDLWVVYVPTFSDPTSPEGWANATAEANGLVPNQYLLAISTDGRQYYLSGYSQGPVSEDQLGQIEQQRVQPALANGDWAGAATAAAAGLADAVKGGSGGSSNSGGGSGGALAPILLVIVVIALAALVIVIVVRSRRKKTPAVTGGAAGTDAPHDPLAQVPTDELRRRAASALVATDDALKTSEQELGFARAQFGDAAAAEFAQALADAKSALDQAFVLQQQLDDATPDTEADVRTWNAQILDLCARANAGLDEKAKAFDELRQLEQNAPAALARVQALRAEVGVRQQPAAAALAVLQGAYAPAALATIADNPAQAAQDLAFADAQLTTAQQAITAGDNAGAAVDIRAAEDAVGQADLLQKAIAKLGTDLGKAEADAAALIADIEHDIATASGLPDTDGRLAGVIATTRGQVDAAKAQLTGPAKQPIAALQSLDAANAQIDATLAGVRDAQAQAQRAAQQLNALMTQAQAQVSAAEDFITSRRGAIGAQARTRLAEAGASLVQARQLQQTDPAAALPYAQRANDLAAQATQAAQADVGAFSGGGMFGGGSGGGGGNMMGAVLGGIVINSLLGGGRGGGYGGGYGGGSRGGYGGGSRGGGGMGPGSFGGGGTRSRRGGGRF